MSYFLLVVFSGSIVIGIEAHSTNMDCQIAAEQVRRMDASIRTECLEIRRRYVRAAFND